MSIQPEEAPEVTKNRGQKVALTLPGGLDKSIKTPDDAVRRYGLPAVISMPGGHVHSCSCPEAMLSHVSPMQADGYVYADYRCNSNWSNIFRFKVNQVRLDSKGNIIEQKEPFRAPGAKKAPKLA